MWHRIILAACAATAVILCASCASVPLATSDLDYAAKEFTPHPEKATLYIVRPSSIVAVAQTVTPMLDQRPLGRLTSGTYFMVLVDPGSHQVAAIAAENVAAVDIEAEPAHLYFVGVQPARGAWAQRVAVELLDEEVGKDRVTSGKRVQLSSKSGATE